MAANCGFCGQAGVTKEHLWPDWLRKVILDSRASGGQKHFHAEIERGGKASQYKNPSLEQRVGMPCGACNSGWMSALENDVKAFVLAPERQTLLSRWAVKTTDDEALGVLDDRFVNVLRNRSSGSSQNPG